MSDLDGRVAGLSPEKRALLARRLVRERAAMADRPEIPGRGGASACPLSFAQERLWFLDQFEPGSGLYNLPMVRRLRGMLDVHALERSLNEIVRRHASLRTTFPDVDGQPVQAVSPSLTIVLPVVDLGEVPRGEGEARARQLAADEVQRPFDLAGGPLVRALLLRLGDDDHVLAVTLHHIVSDGWSMGILSRELSVLYRAFCRGRPSPLPELPIQYADYAVWQREWMQGEVLEEQLAYWRQQLAGARGVLELPTDYARPAVQSYRGAARSTVLRKGLMGALRKLAQQEGATLFMTLLAAFKVLLCRLTGETDIVVGTPIAGRRRTEVEGLIGFFLNTLALRTDLSGNPTFFDLLHRVKDMSLEAYDHQDIPFEKLLQELQPERHLSHTPLFQVLLNMLVLPEGSAVEMPGLRVEGFGLPAAYSKFDLTLYLQEAREGIGLTLAYNKDLFAEKRAIELLEQYEYLLSQIARRPEVPISEHSLVTARARAILPDPRAPLDATWAGSVQEMFSRQACRSPERVAVVDPSECWSYGELEMRSNQLANYLIEAGIQPQEVVAIYGHRSASLVMAVLGVLKAGGVFLILDPAYPPARLEEYLRLAEPRCWIQVEAAGVLPKRLEEFVGKASYRCCLAVPPEGAEAGAGVLGGCPTGAPGEPVGPDDLACITFTSGSTGRPKGILGRHGSLSQFLPWKVGTFGLTHADRFSMLSGLSHDPLQRDIFTPLWVRAAICVPEPDVVRMRGRLADWVAQTEITCANLTPAMGRLLTETAAPGSRLPLLRYAFFIGDRLTRRDVTQLRRLAPGVTCVNLYGSTETQRALGTYVVPSGPEWGGGRRKEEYPVGRGMPGMQLLVLDTEQRLAGVGELGEIYVRSPHLARGYLDDEALTRTSFLASPFTGAAGDRLYRTGDIGRYRADGNIEFVGRLDDQVKIRGFRVEAGEIEAILESHPLIEEALAEAREEEGGDKRLVAYVVPKQKPAPSIRELRGFLGRKLPDYMVPSHFVELDRIPLTPNGKVDRRALPAPEPKRPDLGVGYVAPRSSVEERLAQIWKDVLGLERVGVNDNFFELGGHSLLATRVMSRVRETMNAELPLRTLFATPTIAGLARSMDTIRWARQPREPRGDDLEVPREEGVL
ncbi:MAG: amino acid adenylation domain-containing protein [Anaerolineae bacterium]